MASELYNVIDALSREKGIDPQIVVSAVEDAIALATRKYYKTQENMRGELDKETGEIRAYVYKTVVATTDQVEDPVEPDHAGRGARNWRRAWKSAARSASTSRHDVRWAASPRSWPSRSSSRRCAKRSATRFSTNMRIARSEVLNATVKRIEGQDVIFDLGKAEARCRKREQSRLEQFTVGERVRVVLLKVDRAAKGPQVIVSRAAPELVSNLFQSEVPEIYDNTVVIRAIAREAGERTKIAVHVAATRTSIRWARAWA